LHQLYLVYATVLHAGRDDDMAKIWLPLKHTEFQEIQEHYDRWLKLAQREGQDTIDRVGDLMYMVFILNNHIAALEERIKELEKKE